MLKKNFKEIIIGVLAIASIILVTVEALVPVSQTALIWLYIADLAVCIVFAVDFIQRLVKAENRGRFWKTNWYEILAMIPAFALYAIGTASGLSIVLRMMRLVRVIFLVARMRRAMAKSSGFFQKSNLIAILALTVTVVFIGAVAVLILDAEVEGARIATFSDAVWWSLSTVTTVGYGDIVPHSIGGRIAGMLLMVIGIAVMTAFISQVSAVLVESRMKKNQEQAGIKNVVITEIKNKLDNLDSLSENEVSLLIKLIQSLKKTE
jgi:voltage-gated potassium channel